MGVAEGVTQPEPGSSAPASVLPPELRLMEQLLHHVGEAIAHALHAAVIGLRMRALRKVDPASAVSALWERKK
jgi:hypothetical protein